MVRWIRRQLVRVIFNFSLVWLVIALMLADSDTVRDIYDVMRYMVRDDD